MNFFLLLISIISISSTLLSQDKYLNNYSCSECHEKIYEEYQTSAHSKSYFNDELHREISKVASKSKYGCASCHMPMADNLLDLISGKARPDKNNKTHTDAISCYFCHTIAYVKTSHKFNINIKAKQAENYKPTIYGRLINPEDSDKHSSSNNPIYGKKVCMGCHSHKLNDNNITVFKAMENKDNSLSCIKCHMPELSGGVEKMDKRSRSRHASHKFLGIRDKEFRKKGMDINISVEENRLNITLKNRTTHPLIIQPARVKFLDINIIRDGNIIWKNYKLHPKEDKQGYFAYSFKNGKNSVIIPVNATSSKVNNLYAKESKTLIYKVPNIKKGDKITVKLYVKLAKDECMSIVDVDKELNRAMLMKSIEKIW
jgi:hypothetical protein